MKRAIALALVYLLVMGTLVYMMVDTFMAIFKDFP